MGMKPLVYVTRKLPDEALGSLKDIADVNMWEKEDAPVPRDVLLAEAKRATALLTMLTERVDKELMDACKQLKIIANMAVGYDNIDVEYARKQQIVVTNTPDVLTDTTADLTFALLMAAARRLIEASEYIKRDAWTTWSPFQLAGSDIHHKTLGIVGMGRIGEAVAKRAKGFDMKILYHNRNRKPAAEEKFGAMYCSFDELLMKSDFVVCLAPLTEETKHLFNEDAFRKMKKTAVFINASRGALVDEDALHRALTNGEILSAGLDVFENEPIRSNHPLVRLPNVVALPHIGSATKETRMKMAALAVQNIVSYLENGKGVTPV